MSDVGEMVAWLRGVLDDDERVALAVSDGPNKPEKWTAKQYKDGIRSWRVDGQHSCVVDGAHQHDAEHIARHDPAHELNIVTAHRAVLAEHVPWHFDGNTNPPDRILCLVCSGPNRYGEQCGRTYPCSTLRSLAAGYAGRDGYRAEWGQR